MNNDGSSRLDRIERAIENLTVNIEALHANAGERHAIAQEHIRAIEQLLTASRQDGENIRALARIAEIQGRRLTDLEGGEAQ